MKKSIWAIIVVAAFLVGCSPNPTPPADSANPAGKSVTDGKVGAGQGKGKAAMPPMGADGKSGI